MVGPQAGFHEGQLEAIREVVEGSGRLLVVQRTGWGKSAVYFIATRMLRDRGAGPTIVISPLLSLMRNQLIRMGELGLTADTVNSTNQERWEEIAEGLAGNHYDLVLLSPERLANRYFREQVAPLFDRETLLVVDEAHCISDWGHDFRPHYRGIVRFVGLLPSNLHLLGTTATANDRVIEDVRTQLGAVRILRGPLARESLRIQVIALEDRAERMAWLARELPGMPGTGVVYCLTVADTERVAAWLQSRGLDAHAYHGQLDAEIREDLEQRLIDNRIKVLVATVALGMGFDKPDLGFVVHFQRPGSPVAYYQQVGRAGRQLDDAHAVLLTGREDDVIQQHFIDTAFPSARTVRMVLDEIEARDDTTPRALLQTLNLSKGRLEDCLKFLECEDVIERSGGVITRTANPWSGDRSRIDKATAVRRAELTAMQEFVATRECSMEFIARQLDDPHASRCGRCANCVGAFFESTVEPPLVAEAVAFLRRHGERLRPRSTWPPGGVLGRAGRIAEEERNQVGFALALWNDPGWGELIRQGKYGARRFSDELVGAAAHAIRERWNPSPAPGWVTCVPSSRVPDLVPSFAARLAGALDLPFHAVVRKIVATPPQKDMDNSTYQARNAATAFSVEGPVPAEPVLLVDDVADSLWTFTVIGALLRSAGAGPVLPFALAKATPTSGYR
jgi:ATP-dependent DNA helicase RecQ